MSTVTQISSTNNQQITNYDVSKFLLGDNYFIDGDVTASGADVVLLEGEVMGRIAATQKLVPCVPTATDGSQIPVGVVVVDQTIADGSTESVRLVNKGAIAESKINFSTAVTLATLVVIQDSVPADNNNSRSVRDYLNDLGLVLQGGDELTGYDNQ